MIAQTTLLAFDFDGTLAPICEDPSAVRIDRAAATLLAEASQLQGVVVAIVSGRDADDLAARVDAPGAYIVGSHGLEIRAPGGLPVRDTPPLEAAIPNELRDAIVAAGLRLERKKHAIALHWRALGYAPDPTIVDRFREWASSHGLDLIEGRCVVEARCPGGGKEEALEWLTHAVGVERVLYAGDDVTDFGPLRFAAERGVALFVASSERTAPPNVRVVESFRELFRIVRQEVMI